ncbi:hypothetical protein DIJ64_05960 [Mycobacterium leprae]|uniref:Uncharacterized protein n=1 Tax=Mycobacterium leprae TaxID=1769 RepID=A0AAD0KQU1_MYCLR|nr:hypothetical protein [Mycobacterium leprae]AWV47779.1 hypothetical protein DIJ64_05960 [Mycobacterium leprae]OAR21214.1 hypothetical protein A8144_07595 [Mycobacterium leprae 3125609]OAX70211.1 hypothetical protein A3216_13300 [Mycobacterium leprae 7935681]
MTRVRVATAARWFGADDAVAKEMEMPDQVVCRWLTRWADVTVHPVDQQQAQQEGSRSAM